jgi:DMSO/TMAO reductase YedYZ molybdopterin-dependent catalytic subunit
MKGNRKLLRPILVSLLLLLLAGACLSKQQAPKGVDKAFVAIEGPGVTAEVRLSLADLKGMAEALVEDEYFSINTYGTREYFRFKGVWAWAVLQKASLKGDVSKVSFIAEDGYTAEYTLAEVQREDYIDEQNPAARYKMILAWEENGKEYDSAQGNPFRLVIGQKAAGDVNKPSWVRNVKTIRVE